MTHFIRWLTCRDGATAIEYGFIVGGIAVTCMAAFFLLGGDLGALFNSMGTAMNGATTNVTSG